MRWSKNDLHEGMLVIGTGGERIGKVIRWDGASFVVEKGMFFPKDYELRYDHISGLENGALVYSLTDLDRTDVEARSGELETRSGELGAGAADVATEPGTLFGGRAPAPERRLDASREVRIPLMQEELDVEKFSREAGHVRLHKEVRTEERHFTVPLQREDVVIEHVAATGRTDQLPRDAAFEEETLDLPLYEEDIRVGKHAVLREEVIVRTVAESVEREGATSLRSEELAVEDTRRRAPSPAGNGAPMGR